jgi:hypothetical protein
VGGDGLDAATHEVTVIDVEDEEEVVGKRHDELRDDLWGETRVSGAQDLGIVWYGIRSSFEQVGELLRLCLGMRSSPTVVLWTLLHGVSDLVREQPIGRPGEESSGSPRTMWLPMVNASVPIMVASFRLRWSS